MIRTDLGMTRGKICAQAAHAVLGLFKEVQEGGDPLIFAQWASIDFAQETFQADSMNQLYEAQQAS